MPSLVQAAAGAGVAYGAYVFGRFLATRQPGERVVAINVSPFSMLVAGFWPPKGWLGSAYSHFIPFSKIGKTVVSGIFPLTADRYAYVADAAACKTIMNDRHTFIKETKNYELISFFGENIVGTEGDDWVRHRSIARKSFGEHNNTLLWSETVRTLEDWFSAWDTEIAASADGTTTANVTDTLRDITLCVIASAGFGMHFSRSAAAPTDADAGSHAHRGFEHALFTAIETMVIRVLAPQWMYLLPIRRLKESNQAYADLKQYIAEMIADARKPGNAPGEAADLFRRLVIANEEEDGQRLTDDELLSNIYVFFLAGHETSAHTLTFALALLAIHPEIQDKLFEEAKRLWPESSGDQWLASTLSEFNSLEYTLAVFRETLRIFPAEPTVQRTATRDVLLPCHVRRGPADAWQPAHAPVGKGVKCTVNIHAVHMSPIYWGDDVKTFRPERFIDDPATGYTWPRDAWIPFTGGPHVCLGQRFAIVESVCILARLMRRYRLAPTPEIARLPFEEQWARLTKWTVGVTSTPGRVDLVLQKRED